MSRRARELFGAAGKGDGAPTNSRRAVQERRAPLLSYRSSRKIGDDQLLIGLFEFATCHQHYHFRHYALYELLDQAGNVWRAAKRGFCMIDVEKYGAYPGPNNIPRQFGTCGAPGVVGNQGITAGWADTYVWKLGGQYVVLDGGDGQPAVPPGEYTLRITVNPPFLAQAGEPCPAKDLKGFCHQFAESDYANNTALVTVTVPDHNGRQAVGPLKNEPTSPIEPIDPL